MVKYPPALTIKCTQPLPLGRSPQPRPGRLGRCAGGLSGVLCTQQHRQKGTSKIQSLESLFPRAFLETAGSYFKKLHP